MSSYRFNYQGQERPLITDLKHWLPENNLRSPDEMLPQLRRLKRRYPWAWQLFAEVCVENHISLSASSQELDLFGILSATLPPLGPNVALEAKNNVLSSFAIRGASSVERSLANLVNNSLLMEPDLRQIKEVHLFKRTDEGIEEASEMLTSANLPVDKVDLSSGSQLLSVELGDVRLHFWSGFSSSQEAEEARLLRTFLMNQTL